jgi:hypothetical protein
MADVQEHEQRPAAPAAAGSVAAAPQAAHPLLALQRSAGNRAAVLQTKLSVGRADDPAEREADRVAAEVLRKLHGGEAGSVRRSAAGHDELGGQEVSANVQAGINASSGRPMDAGTQSKMESAFGASFSDVRIHDGAQADTLSQSLQAEAFTTGNDVFFRQGGYDPSSSGGQELLAHELTHVVQQGGAVGRKVRRFVDVKTFAEKTNEGTFTAKSSAQKEIETLLAEYAKLGAKDKQGKIVVPETQSQKAIDLLRRMKAVADQWWEAHTIEEEKDDGSTELTVDPSRKKRATGFQWFRTAVGQELDVMENQLFVADAFGREQAQFTPDERGKMKLDESYTGGLKGGLALIAKGLEKLVPRDGDSTEFNLDLKIPVQPGVFVGALLKLEAEKDDGTIEVGAELAVQAGGSVGVAEIAGALGGYLKAGAKTAENVMKLISFGFYRRCAESNLPYEVQAMIWGGGTGEFNRKKADKWSLGVETDLLGEGENGEENENYVELGGLAKVKAGADIGVAEIEGEAQYSSGRRYDAQSIKNAKGKAGEKNKKSGDWFTQNVASGFGRGADETTGRSTNNVALSVEAGFLGGALKGSIGLEAAWRDQGLKGDKRKEQGAVNTKLEELEIEVAAEGKLPVDGLTSRLVSLGSNIAMYGKEKVKALVNKTAAKPGVPVTELLMAKEAAETTFAGVAGVPFADWVSESMFGPAEEGAESAMEAESSVGLELSVTFAKEGEGWEAQLDLKHVKGMDVKLPELLEVELVRKSRVVGAKYSGGTWTKLVSRARCTVPTGLPCPSASSSARATPPSSRWMPTPGTSSTPPARSTPTASSWTARSSPTARSPSSSCSTRRRRTTPTPMPGGPARPPSSSTCPPTWPRRARSCARVSSSRSRPGRRARMQPGRP